MRRGGDPQVFLVDQRLAIITLSRVSLTEERESAACIALFELIGGLLLQLTIVAFGIKDGLPIADPDDLAADGLHANRLCTVGRRWAAAQARKRKHHSNDEHESHQQ